MAEPADWRLDWRAKYVPGYKQYMTLLDRMDGTVRPPLPDPSAPAQAVQAPANVVTQRVVVPPPRNPLIAQPPAQQPAKAPAGQQPTTALPVGPGNRLLARAPVQIRPWWG